MIFKSQKKFQFFLAGDHTRISEILHPKNDAVNLDYSLAEGSLEPGTASLPHILTRQSELYYFLEGEGMIFVNDESCKIQKGDTVLVPNGATQHLVNQGSGLLRFLCVVAPPWKEEDEIIL